MARQLTRGPGTGVRPGDSTGLAATHLTPRQAALARAAVDPTCLTVTAAAVKAGYAQRENASRSLRTATVQREIQRLKAANGDTARSLRRASLSRCLDLLPTEQDPGRLSQIALNAATVEEKLGAEEVTERSRATDLRLAFRFLLIWVQEHGRWHSPSGCVCSRLDKAFTVLSKIEADLAVYAAALRA